MHIKQSISSSIRTEQTGILADPIPTARITVISDSDGVKIGNI